MDIAYDGETLIVDALINRIVRGLRLFYRPSDRPYDGRTELRNRQSSVQGTTLTPPILAAEKGNSKGKPEKALMYSQGPDQHP